MLELILECSHRSRVCNRSMIARNSLPGIGIGIMMKGSVVTVSVTVTVTVLNTVIVMMLMCTTSSYYFIYIDQYVLYFKILL